MTDTLELILDDLRSGLARRRARRRRARAAGAALSSAAMLAIGVVTAGETLRTPDQAAAADTTLSAQLLAGGCARTACWPGAANLNVPQDRRETAP